MNIFFLSYSPEQSAKWMVDRHVVKMILESAQLLSTAHRVLDGKEYIDTTGKRKVKRWVLNQPMDQLYNATHVNHPSAVWVRESNCNYEWLFDHFVELNKEYTHRYGKVHKCFSMISLLKHKPLNIPKLNEMTPIKCAMKQEFIVSEDPIENYRNYYKNGKVHLFSWKNRQPPVWINSTHR